MPVYLQKKAINTGEYYFLSYKKEDKNTLLEIVPHLQFNAWYDFGLHYAEVWSEEIAKSLINSSAVILFLSKELLKPGISSFPYYEYDVAKRHKKDVLVVYLDDVTNDDIPASLEFWISELHTKRCLFFEANRTRESLIEEIHHAVADIVHKHTGAPPINPVSGNNDEGPHDHPPKTLELKCFSTFNDHKIMYTGLSDGHVSTDRRKLCLYNYEQQCYEVRAWDNLNYTYARIHGKPNDLKHCRLLYTAQGKYCYYYRSERLYIYDIAKEQYTNPNGTRLPLRWREKLVLFMEPLAGNDVFMLTIRDGIVYRSIHYNIAANKIISITNLKKHKLNSLVCAMNDLNLNAIVGVNDRDEPVLVNLETGHASTPTPEVFEQYFNRFTHVEDDVNGQISHDGKLYRALTAKGFRILDTETRATIHEELDGACRNLYLLRNRKIVTLDHKGNVWIITPSGRRKLFDPEYFKASVYFEGKIPHTMLYDEIAQQYIFVLETTNEQEIQHRIVVTDRKGTVVQISKDIQLPVPCICDIKIVRGDLTVLFSSPKEAFAHFHHTFIFSGPYR